jgi:hypothetical protein
MTNLRTKILGTFIAFGLGTGVLVSLNSDGCIVKPTQNMAVENANNVGKDIELSEKALTPALQPTQ